MRRDAALALLGSLVIVVVAGWYLTRQDRSQSVVSIPQDDRLGVSPGSALVGVDHDEDDGDRSGGPDVVLPAGAFDGGGQDGTSATIADLFAADSVDSDELEEHHGKRGNRDDKSQGAFKTAGGEQGSMGRVAERHPAPPEPPGLRPESSKINAETHTVREGDTIASIARMYYGDIRYSRLLREANPDVVDPTSIAVGTVIVIPDAGNFHPESKPDRSKRASKPSITTGRTYTVQEGDTLYDIARQQLGAGSRWQEIHKLNRAIIGDDPGRLKVGQVLTLPPK